MIEFIEALEHGFESRFLRTTWMGVKGHEISFHESNVGYIFWDLQKWLREKHKIHVEVRVYSCSKPMEFEYGAFILPKSYGCWQEIGSASSYEEALEICLKEALKLIK